MLTVEGLSTSYGRIQALKNISFSVCEGDLVCIIGANGAGKSTLLKSVMGLVKSQQGTVKFLEQEIVSLPTHRIVRLGMGLVPERRQLFGPLSVLDNLKLGAYPWIRGSRESEWSRQLDWVYRLFPILEERRSQKAGTLSGGQQQMLAIGRALMSKVKLLLLDETSLGLAPMVVKDIFRTLTELHQEGMTVVLVEQNARLALRTTYYAYVLENGRITHQGRSSDLLEDERVTHAYLGVESGGGAKTMPGDPSS